MCFGVLITHFEQNTMSCLVFFNRCTTKQWTLDGDKASAQTTLFDPLHIFQIQIGGVNRHRNLWLPVLKKTQYQHNVARTFSCNIKSVYSNDNCYFILFFLIISGPLYCYQCMRRSRTLGNRLNEERKPHKPTKTMAIGSWNYARACAKIELGNFMVMYYNFESVNDWYCSYNFSPEAHFTNRNPK